MRWSGPALDRVLVPTGPDFEVDLFATIIAGLTAGAVHVLAGPDHLAAVAPLAANGDGSPWRSGLFWGFGHAGGVLLVGFAAILLRGLIPIELLSAWSEQLVGLVLIGIGAWGIWRARRQGVHTHEHSHGQARHVHLHVHPVDREERREHASGSDHPHGGTHVHARTSGMALGVGILHGLAGSAHFLGVLPALALPTRTAAAAYVACFGLGTVAAMTGFAALIGRLSGRSAARGTRAYQRLLGALGLLAIAVGIVWLLP
ncbi:MAG: High-affinity nickel transporter [Gemmatimonadota bacterium]